MAALHDREAPMSAQRAVTACLIVIGNEILSGRTADKNLPYLAARLNELGIRLAEARVVPDVEEAIVRAVNECRAAHDYVFTTGGIGPTHDDITIPAIAAAFGVRAVSQPDIEAAIRAHYAGRLTEAHLLMALVPEGAEVLSVAGRSFGQVRFRNVFILPGVPQLFQHRFHRFKHRFQGEPVLLKEVFLKADEGTIAASLREVSERFPEVLIGSYPNFFKAEYSVKVTLEARQDDLLDAAMADLQGRLAALPITIVRVS